MNRKILYAIIAVLAIVAICITFFAFIYLKNVKEPFNINYKIENTEIHLDSSFNDKYKIIRLDLTVDEIIEDWQIDSIGENTYITLICETPDKTIKKEYYFDNATLKSGEKLKASLILEDAKLKDYSMLKDLLKGTIQLETSEYLSLNAETRNKLQKEYYHHKKHKVVTPNKETAVKYIPQTNNSFLDNLFNF